MRRKGQVCLLIVSLGFILFLIGTTPIVTPDADVGSTSHSPTEAFALSIVPGNSPPVAMDDAYTTDEDTLLIIDALSGVLANDSDVDGDLLDCRIVAAPSHGSLDFNVDGSFTYAPEPNWFSEDSFVYEVSDGTFFDTATVTIAVNPVDDPSVAVDDYVVTHEDVPIIIDVCANDYDVEGDAFFVSGYGYSPPQPHGQLRLVTVDGTRMIRYTPSPNWYGSAWFRYSIYKIVGTAHILQNSAYVYITVNPVNDAPVAVDDFYATNEDTTLTVDAAAGVIVNDTDVDGDTLTSQLVTEPSRGSVVLNADGSFTYTPNVNWFGEDSFVYEASDGTFFDTATVTITVVSVNGAPVGEDDFYTINEDTTLSIDVDAGVLSNDTDIDGDTLQAILESSPSNGVLTLNADGSFSYTPDADFWGTVSFTYYVTDGFLDSNVVTVTITVNAVNDAPVAVDDAYTTDEDVPLTVVAPGLLVNDSDVDGDSLTAVLVDAPLHGSVLVDADGALSYIPDADWYGVDTMTYQVFDGTDYSNIATVTITVNYVNTPPTAVGDDYTTEAGVPLIVPALGVLDNDSDVDDDTLEAMLINTPMHGTVILYSNGSFTYTPDAAWCGVDTFTYNVFDGREYSNIAVVTITVIDVTPPVTTIQFTGDEGEYGWYHSDVEVTLTATDDCSGVASTVYSLNGSTWMLYADPFALSDPGEVTIYYYSTDFAGNVERIKTATIKIGKPTRSFVTGGGWIWDSGGKGHFMFVVKHKCGVLKGVLIYIFRDDGYKHIVKSSHWFGMAIDGDHAILEGKANILRYNYGTKNWECFKNFYFRIEIWDKGKCESDVFQIRIYDESGEQFHEAGFDPLGDVHRGNIRIHHRGPKCMCWHWSRKWRSKRLHFVSSR